MFLFLNNAKQMHLAFIVIYEPYSDIPIKPIKIFFKNVEQETASSILT